MTPEDPIGHDPFRRDFPTLPIVTADDDRLTGFQKFGGLYPLGIAGLIVLLGLIGWFAWSVWSLRAVWSDVYVLHDASRPLADRARAAHALGQSADVNQRQRWEIALNADLPPLARYVIAEGLTAEATAADPRAYGMAVARSEGWPDWLRLILTRPMACAAALGRPVSTDSLRELVASHDPAIALLARFALASSSAEEHDAAERLREASRAEGTYQALAIDLVAALDAKRFEDKLLSLDSATIRLRAVPPATALWQGWRIREGRLQPLADSDVP